LSPKKCSHVHTAAPVAQAHIPMLGFGCSVKVSNSAL